MKHSATLEKVIAILYETSRALNTRLDYSEHCYQTFIMTRLQQEKFAVNKEVTCHFRYKNIRFGYGRIDLLVTTEDEVIVIELKANVQNKLKALNQLKKYLTHYKTCKKVRGVLAMYNCGGPLEITKLSSI